MNIFFDENVILELRIHLSNLLLGITVPIRYLSTISIAQEGDLNKTM
jgi:hypothetical protein